MILLAVLLTLLMPPALLAVAGWRAGARRDAVAMRSSPWDWNAVAISSLLYALAFNLTFFIQELFLVVPKALTPGLRPTLFHNNHRWLGENDLASLFQGTGALATALVGLVCLVVLGAGSPRPGAWRLFVIWMAYCGLLMALPQVVIGAMSPASDVGMAMTWLGLSSATKRIAALLALVAIAAVALALLRPALELAHADGVATARARTRFIAQTIALPMLIGTALVIPFRVPREMIEVVLLPVLVGLPGALWMLAGAWRVRDVHGAGVRLGSFVLPLLAAVVLLLVFQLLLRPGVAFY